MNPLPPLNRRQVLESFVKVSSLMLLTPTLSSCVPPILDPPVNLPPDLQPYPQTVNAPAPLERAKPAGAPWFAPNAPEYPYYAGKNPDALLREAQGISDALERYIVAWLGGRVSAQIPTAFLPRGYNPDFYKAFRLARPEQVAPEDQWIVRPAEPLELDSGRGGLARGSFPDPNVTYLLCPMYAPFGHRATVEGEFPHARFFDLQATPPLDPRNYRYNQTFGVPEVPMVDVDIDPLPGQVNPFRVGANRAATARRYAVSFELKMGDPVALEPAFKPPLYRAPGNTRAASGIQYQGAWGLSKNGGHGRGLWDLGQLWVRYYAPDRNVDARGGVRLPKLTYQLPDGRKYCIVVDQSALDAIGNRKVAVAPTPPEAPKPQYGPLEGWNKEFGILNAIAMGTAINSNFAGPEGKRYVRDLDRGVASRGLELPAPANYEPSATSATYVNYLLRGMSLEAGKVVVLTGRLPTTPRTRGGEASMTAAQARYWSLTGYSTPTLGETIDLAFNPNAVTGIPVQSIMDDEFVTDSQNRFVLVLSRPQDRPGNATAQSGVTWLNWGPRGEVSWTLRWLSVGPEWAFEKTPDEVRLPPSRSAWSSVDYDRSLIGNNTHSGFLGDLLPRIHYLTRAEFEALGSTLTLDSIPVWR